MNIKKWLVAFLKALATACAILVYLFVTYLIASWLSTNIAFALILVALIAILTWAYAHSTGYH